MSKDIQIVELENDDITIQLEGNVVTWQELNGNPEKNKALINLLTRLLAEKISKNEPIEADTHTKITYDSNGLVISGEDLSVDDLPEMHLENIVDVEATVEEVNKLHNLQATQEEIDKLHNLQTTSAELEILHGLETSTEELNKLKGLLVDFVQLNELQGIRGNIQEQLDSKMDSVDFEIESQSNKTDEYDINDSRNYPSSKALKDGLATKQDKLTEEQINNINRAVTDENINDLIANKLDKNSPIEPGTATKVEYDENGLIVRKRNLVASDIPELKLKKISDVNTTAAELNQLKGITVEAEDLNKLEGIESNVQNQINNITDLISREASVDNKLADKEFVKNWVYDHAGFFLSKDPYNTPFNSMAELLSTHQFYDNGVIKRLSEHDYTVITCDETHNNSVSLYAWIRDEIYNEGHWVYQYKISSNWGAIIGNIQEQEDLMNEFQADRDRISSNEIAISNHTLDMSNPHNVTKVQVGLGNVDNTSDINKPISTATQSALNSITEKIPTQATAQNQLADKDYVNSSVSTATATFRGTYQNLEALNNYSGEKDNNDYAFVIDTDGEGNTLYKRYKYDGNSWEYEYSLNNSSFTAAHWAAITSGITSSIVSSISNKIELADLSTDATGLTYNNTTGVLSLSEGYVIPTQTKIDDIQRNYRFTELNITKTTNSYSTIDLAKEIAGLKLPVSTTLFGEVTLNDMPTGIGNAELKVEVQQKSGSTSVLAFTLTSTNVAPHQWEFYWVGSSTSGNPSTVSWYATVRENNVLMKTNTTSYTPTGDYNPATKKYVDDKATWGQISGTLASQTDLNTALGNKQDTLASGINIKTINSTSLLGNGDIVVQPTLVSGTNIKTINSTSLLGNGDITVQPTLISGTNIKTINGSSVLGSGDLTVSASAQSINVLVGTSITLIDNSINTLTPTDNITFTLPTVSDGTILHQILVQLNLSTVYTIDLGTTTYFNGIAPDLSNVGNYNLIYEFDNAMSEWVVGAIVKE